MLSINTWLEGLLAAQNVSLIKIMKKCIFDKPSTRFFMEIMKFAATPLVYFNSKLNVISY